jgi:phosphatidylglycerophosphatase A
MNNGNYLLAVKLLEEEGVDIMDLAQIVYDLQKKYVPVITLELAKESVLRVLEKREVVFALMTGLELDRQARNKTYINKELQKLIIDDEPLFGIDEVIAYSICNIYGSIALTNFGYIDKIKPGIIGKINDDKTKCNTFMDDILGAICASAASRFAHRSQ